MAQNLKQQAKKKAFSPKMLVYENLKNENVLKHFKNRFAQLDTLLNHPIWVKSPVINLGLNSQHTAHQKHRLALLGQDSPRATGNRKTPRTGSNRTGVCQTRCLLRCRQRRRRTGIKI